MAVKRGLPFVNALVVLVILACVGLLASRVFARLDLTENKEYTLSPATRNVLERLDDVVKIDVYFSKELPPYFATLDRQVKDLLDEYAANGGARLEIRFTDPASDPILEQTMQQLGIPKLQLTRYEKERAEAMNAYLGIAVGFEDKTEVIPVVEAVERLEYDLTSALVKVSTERRTVGIATAGGLSVPEDFRGLQQVLGEQFTVQAVDVTLNPVPDNVTTLIVIDDDAFTDEALYRIDQFIMRGGRALFLAGGVDVTVNTLMARNRQVKVGPLLRDYGVEVQSALVVDAQAPMVGFDVGTFFPLSLRYPWFPQVVPDGLSRENPVTSDLQSVVLPWTSPLTTVAVDTASGAAVTTEVLARSSARSFAATSPYTLNPQARITPPEVMEPQDLVVALSGRFPSPWRGGRAVPGDSLGTAPPGADLSPETQLIVAGSAHFASGRFLQQFNANAIFLANAVDWMTLGSDLIAIRSRGAAARPLREVEDNRRTLLKGLAVFPVPILVVLFGLVRAQIRRGRRNRYALEFGGKR